MSISQIQRWSSCYICGIFALVLIAVKTANGQRRNVAKSNSGILFTQKSWQDIKAMAKQQHKMIFVDAYAVWCAPCKQLKEQTFKDQQVAAYFNRRFINVSMNIEKGEGVAMADEFDILAYPALLWLDENGKLIKRSEGFVTAEQLLAMVKREGSMIDQR